jgi:hypothetical protein
MPRTPNTRQAWRATSRSHRPSRPAVEGLEGRLLLYATGGGWSRPERITFSFAPDGTDIGGIPSGLNAAMVSRGISAQDWRDAFREAAAVWSQFSGFEFSEVSDNGVAFGTPGNQQNDGRFGDIRIGGANLGSGSLGLAFSPPPSNGGTIAGDIVINQQVPWSLKSDYNVETVAIHEFGHALGMSHSTISQAVMYAYYTGIKVSLGNDDLAGIQSVYGTRQPDNREGTGNQTYNTATVITGNLDASGRAAIPGLNINILSDGRSYDQDWYLVKAPANPSSTLTVTMQSSNLSLLSPKVMVYNSSLQLVGQDSAPFASGATVTASVGGVTPNATYYIRALPAQGGLNGTGAYGLLVNFGGGTMAPIAPPDTTVLAQPDQGGGASGYSTGDPHDRPGSGLGLGLGLGSGLGQGLAPGRGKGLGLVQDVLSGAAPALDLIKIGNLQGYGDEYSMAPRGLQAGSAGVPNGRIGLLKASAGAHGLGFLSQLPGESSDLTPFAKPRRHGRTDTPHGPAAFLAQRRG